jgi:chromosome partitioning protein
VTLCILDTAGAESPATHAAMKAADLNVIPSRPNAFDLWATEQTRKTLRELGREFVFLLNQCPPAQQNSRVEDGVKALEAMGGLISPLVSSRVDYQEAARHGYGVSELNPSGQAAEEMRKLWSSLKRRLAKVKTAPPSRKAA